MQRLLFNNLLILFLLFSVTAGVFAAPIPEKVPVNDKWLALVIEDAESPAELQQVLAVCSAYNAKVTFFLAGSVIEKNQQLVRQAADSGHEFGNHGLSHRYWGDSSQAAIRQEIQEAGSILQRVVGRDAGLFLPPYSYYDEKFLSAVQEISKQGIVVKGTDLTDWMQMSKDAIRERAKSAASNGSIILINYKVKQAAEALPDILAEWRKQGYTVITVSELKSKTVVLPPGPQTAKPKPQTGFWGVINHVNVSQPMVALTFDDGGSRYRVSRILDVLQANQAKATFFLLGNWVNSNPDLVRRLAAEGHEIANHSFSHPSFAWLDTEEMSSEIVTTQTAIAEAAGQSASAYFRPPYGSYNSAVIQTVKDLGYQAVVMWDIDTRDWSGRDADSINEHVLSRVEAGSIVLFHLHGTHTPDALAELIPELKRQGYSICTVGEMLQTG